jgi:3-isopropylmalate dehydratase small subunit
MSYELSYIHTLMRSQLAPAEYIIHAHSNEAISQHCLEHTDPEFRDRVKQGFNVVVAGKGFGCG